MFSDLTDKTAKVSFGKTEEGFTVECAIALCDDKGEIKEQRVRLFTPRSGCCETNSKGGVNRGGCSQ